MKSILFAISLSVFVSNPPPVVAPERALDPIGTCEGRAESVDIRRLMFLRSTTLDAEIDGEPVRIEIDRERISIRSIADNQEMYEANVDYLIDPDANLDVALTLGLLDGRLILYWRETFINKIYRQGIFAINKDGVSQICEGRGGISSSH